MSRRLSSFHSGPSTPSPSRQQPGNPSSPSRLTESVYHRKIRTLLLELRVVANTWDSLVLLAGLKAAKSLVDTRTELEYVSPSPKNANRNVVHSNALAITPGKQPRTRLVGPKLTLMEKRIAELDTVISKLVRILSSISWKPLIVRTC